MKQKNAGTYRHNVTLLGREVVVNDEKWNGPDQPKTPRTRKGVFHVWGYRRLGGHDAPPVMQTVAVIELDDGRITTKLPEQITFVTNELPTRLDQFNEEQKAMGLSDNAC